VLSLAAPQAPSQQAVSSLQGSPSPAVLASERRHPAPSATASTLQRCDDACMTTPQQVTLTLDPDAVDLAARLAKTMTADPDASARLDLGADEECTVQDVAAVAYLRGIEVLAQQYLNKG